MKAISSLPSLKMQVWIDHATLRTMHGILFRLLFSLWMLTPFSLVTIYAQPAPEVAEWTPGNPVTNESVEAGLRRVRETYRASPDFLSDNPKTHLTLAGLLAQQGDPNGAIEEYRAAIREAPDLAEAYRGLGAILIDKHEWSEAIEALQHGVRLDSEDRQSFYWLGRAFLARQDYSNAAQAFSRACALNPEEAETWSDLALAYMAQGQPREAEDALRRAIQLKPDFTEAHHRLETVTDHRSDPPGLTHATHELLAILFRRE